MTSNLNHAIKRASLHFSVCAVIISVVFFVLRAFWPTVDHTTLATSAGVIIVGLVSLRELFDLKRHVDPWWKSFADILSWLAGAITSISLLTHFMKD
jgi:uncharacterized membrane protein HdeD (DUF308 family)